MTAGVETRCDRTDLLVGECAHCRPSAERDLILLAVASRSTPGQRRKAAGRSRNQAKTLLTESASDVDLVARFLPAGLIDLYARLLEAEFGSVNLGGPPSSNRDELVGVGRGSGPRTRTSQSETRSVARSSTGQSHTRAVIRSERAVWGRYRFDSKLKKLVVDLQRVLSEIDGADVSKPVKRQCAGKCKKFGDPDHIYCPRCGGPMQDVEA